MTFVFNLHPIKIDDGVEFICCSAEEAQALFNERLIVPCNGDCPKGTFHLGGCAQGLGQVEDRLNNLRREGAS